MHSPVYLDHNATTPLLPEVQAQVPRWLESWGNPSSIHWAGRGPKTLIREARQNLARMVGAESLELIFTSGGSEANNLALKGMCDHARAKHDPRDHIIVSNLEHPSVTKTVEHLRAQGFRVDVARFDKHGVIDLEAFKNLLNERTLLVTVMLANNETGHILPVAEMTALAHTVGARVHCDTVQALGKMEFNLRDLGVDSASLSGHKFYALKGCGLLYARRGLNLTSLVHGGGQERGRRAGTENLLGIASLGYMASRANEVPERIAQMRALRDHLEARVIAEIENVEITTGHRLCNTSSMTLADVDGETLLMNLDVRGFAVSTGAACSSGNPEPSPTLLAMGFTRDEAQSSLRVSLGWQNTLEEIDAFVEALKISVGRLRGFRHGEKFAYGV